MEFIINAFNAGGPFMYVIAAFGIGTIAVMAERYRSLYLRLAKTPSFFQSQVREFLTRGDIRGAEMLAVQLKSPLGEIVAAGCKLRKSGAGDEVLQARMDEKLSEAIHTVDKNSGFLGMFGNVATLIGLLGTITGMIHSFAAVALATPMERSTLLSKGISEAMNCTAFGLLVAIPALVAYAIFQNKTEKLIQETTDITTQVYHDLLFCYDVAPAARADAGNESRIPVPSKSALVAESHTTV